MFTVNKMQILIKNCLINCSQCCKYLTNNRLTNDRNEKMYKIFFPDGEERNNQAWSHWNYKFRADFYINLWQWSRVNDRKNKNKNKKKQKEKKRKK